MTVSYTVKTATAGLAAYKDAYAGGTMRIYGGPVPADVDAALGGAVLLAEMTLADPAFGAIAASGNDLVCSLISAATDPLANATGTASFFRVLDHEGDLSAQGTAGGVGSNQDMELTYPNLEAGVPVQVAAISLRVQRKG